MSVQPLSHCLSCLTETTGGAQLCARCIRSDAEPLALPPFVARLRKSINRKRQPYNDIVAVRPAQAAALLECAVALVWASRHSYAGGKAFADVEPVKSALANLRALS